MTSCILRHGDMSAVILPEKGGTLTRLTRKGRDFIYEDPENLNSPERPRCGIPFLFPMFGRLQDETYTWEGQSYHMGIHGFAHTSCWQIADSAGDFVRLVLESSPETKAMYPFDFRVSLIYRLELNQLSIKLKFENTGNVPMPFNYGFHPYFLTEKPENIHVETAAETFFDFAVGGRAFGSGSVTLSVPQGAPEAGAAFMGVTGPTVLHNEAEARKLTMDFDPSFHTHVLWTQAGKRFLCVEPVNGSADGLNTGNYMTLAPGERKQAFLSLRAENL